MYVDTGYAMVNMPVWHAVCNKTYGHHVSETLALTLTLYHLPTSYPGGPVHYTFVICELYYIILTW